jgi:regulator of protease activity HflC (stomatin/prohibitin superfamily)
MAELAVMPLVVVELGFVRILKRFGVVSRVLTPGINLLNPFLDSYVAVNWFFDEAGSRVRGVDIPTNTLRFDPELLECVTKDEMRVGVDILVEFRVTDAVRAATSTPNLFASVETLIKTALLESVRSVLLAQLTAVSIQQAVATNLEKACETYGFMATRVFVEGINIPEEIRSATVQVEAQRRHRVAELEKLEQESGIQLSQQRLQLQLVQAAAIQQQQMSSNEQKKLKAEALASIEIEDFRLEQTLKRERTLRELDLEFYRNRLAVLRNSGLPSEVIVALARCDALASMAKDPAAKLILASNDALERTFVHTGAQMQPAVLLAQNDGDTALAK